MGDYTRLTELWDAFLRWKPKELRPGERYWFSDVVDRARQTRSYEQLARFREACAMVKLWWYQVHPEDFSSDKYFDSVGDLILASHWFHRAGEDALAKAAGSRALSELNRLFPHGEFREEMNGDGWEEWFAREMMGDAAVWVDAQLALQQYQEAIRGFRTMENYEHLAAWNEIFPGGYTLDMTREFLKVDPREDFVYGEKRVKCKVKRWLGVEL